MESFLTTVSNLIREKELPALMIGTDKTAPPLISPLPAE